MPKLPILLILLAAGALGAINLRLRFQGIRRPYLIGAHLLLGLGALEVLVYFLKDVNNGDGLPAGPFGNVAAALLGAAAFAGLITPVLGRKSPQYSNYAVVAHVACGLAGIVVGSLWVLGQ